MKLTSSDNYIEEWNKHFSRSEREDCLFVSLLKNDLAEWQIEEVLKTIDKMCKHCWDNFATCQCWKEE